MAVSVNRSSVREGGYVTVTVKTSADVAAVTVNGIAMRRMLTVRGERLAWTADVRASKVGELRLDVVAANADGIASETITETVTVTEKSRFPVSLRIFSRNSPIVGSDKEGRVFMKKIYSKPEIMFDSFTLTTNIAAGCGKKNRYPCKRSLRA